MSRLVLIVVAAAWAAVLLPPLLRSRMDARPGSSVSSFRRQLTSLQRSVPGSGVSPMRSMARPLAGSPTRPGYGPVQRTNSTQARRGGVVAVDPYDMRTARAGQGQRRAAPARTTTAAKQRRQNILMGLLIATVGTGLLAFTTAASSMKYAFALSICLLIGYVYLLLQAKRSEDERSVRQYWHSAA
jgi:hypothetical protein